MNLHACKGQGECTMKDEIHNEAVFRTRDQSTVQTLSALIIYFKTHHNVYNVMNFSIDVER